MKGKVKMLKKAHCGQDKSGMKQKRGRRYAKPVSVLLAAALLCGLAGCGKNEADISAAESFSDDLRDSSGLPQGSEADESLIGQSGCRSEFNFDEAVKNFTLFERNISLPCTIGEFGEVFSADKEILVLNSGEASSNLLYQEEIIGTVTLSDCKANDLPDDKQIASLSLGFPADYGYKSEEERDRKHELYGEFSGLIRLDFAGISFKTTPNGLLDKLGAPSENTEEIYDGIRMRRMSYSFSGGNLYFSFADDKLYWIVIAVNSAVEAGSDMSGGNIGGVGNAEESSSEASADSSDSARLRFRNERLLEQHYQKHGIEMGFSSAEEYEKAAAAVPDDPEALHKIEAEDGDDVYYIERTNEFVIVSVDGYIRTYFNPDRGIDYFNRQ